MKIKMFIGEASNMARKLWNKARRHGPEIGIVVGIACGVGGFVGAIIQTKKLDKVKEETDVLVNSVKAGMSENPTSEEKRALTAAYIRKGFEYARHYAVPVGLEICSVVLIGVSAGTMKKRYLAVSAANLALMEELKLAKAKDEKEETEEEIIENAKKEPDREPSNVTTNGLFKFCWNDVANPGFVDSNPDINERFLRSREWDADKLFLARGGELWYSEALDLIGVDPANLQAGYINGTLITGKDMSRIFGWNKAIYGNSDGIINFRITAMDRENEDGTFETVFWLNPNIDGNILDAYCLKERSKNE